MKLAFYNADAPNREKYDKLVDLWTGRYGYSHCELVFSDNIGFSASPREGCVRFKQIDFSDSLTWTLVDLDVYPKLELKMRLKANSVLGNKYDWKGIFLYEFLPLKIEDKNKWWCSEVCAWVLGLENYRIHPNKLAQIFNVPKRK